MAWGVSLDGGGYATGRGRMPDEYKTDSLGEAFDLVAATRRKGFLHSTFNPLSSAKVTELKGLLDRAVETIYVAREPALKESLLVASSIIDEAQDQAADKKNKTLSNMQRQLYKNLKKRFIPKE